MAKLLKINTYLIKKDTLFVNLLILKDIQWNCQWKVTMAVKMVSFGFAICTKQIHLFSLPLIDASDWDSASTTSKASKNFPVHKLEEEPVFESPAASALPITPQQQEVDTKEHEEASPERNKPTTSSTQPLPSPRSLNPNGSSKPRPLPRLRLDSNQRPESEGETRNLYDNETYQHFWWISE